MDFDHKDCKFSFDGSEASSLDRDRYLILILTTGGIWLMSPTLKTSINRQMFN